MVPIAPEDDELPPWLGERYRDITMDIHRAATETALDERNAYDD